MPWNPATLRQPYRQQTISTKFRGIQLIGLQGTRLQAQTDLPHTRFEAPFHTIIHAGYAKINGAWEDHAGVAWAIHRGTFPARSIRKIAAPAQGSDIQGRALAVTVAKGLLRINAIVAYFPPPPQKK